MVSTVSLPAAAEAVVTFLANVGHRSEAELYLRLFQQLPKHSFALVAVDAAADHAPGLGSLLDQLRFLADLGLVAPIVVGLLHPESADRSADQLEEALSAAGLSPALHRVTEPSLPQHLRDELSAERVPILVFPPDVSPAPRARFACLGALAAQLDTRKIAILRPQGSLRLREDRAVDLSPSRQALWEGGQVSLVNLRRDLKDCLEQDLLRPEDAELIVLVRELLAPTPQGRLTVSVASPANVLRELFTVKGAGTLIKSGSEIVKFSGYGELSRGRLQGLIERSFERPLRPGLLERRPLAIYLEADYRGAAIIEPGRVAPYLTKFVVEPAAQGEGMGHDLWQAFVSDHPAVIWRANPQNPIAPWYIRQSDGFVRLPRWQVFWRGIDPGCIPAAIEEASSRPEDLGS